MNRVIPLFYAWKRGANGAYPARHRGLTLCGLLLLTLQRSFVVIARSPRSVRAEGRW